jgi:hypothetical protein
MGRVGDAVIGKSECKNGENVTDSIEWKQQIRATSAKGQSDHAGERNEQPCKCPIHRCSLITNYRYHRGEMLERWRMGFS